MWRALLICKYLILSSPAATIVIVLGFGDVSSRACNATMNQTHVAIRIRRERQRARRTIRATSPGLRHTFARIRHSRGSHNDCTDSAFAAHGGTARDGKVCRKPIPNPSASGVPKP